MFVNELKTYQEGSECYHKGIKINPNDFYGYINNVSNRLKRRTQEALECFIINKAILLNQNNSFGIKNRNFA